MRTILFTFIFLFAGAASLRAQETLFDSLESGGYGAPFIDVTPVHHHAGILVGGRGGWILNHCFVIGGAGGGLANRVNIETYGPDSSRYAEFGYGGLFIAYVFAHDRLVHPAISVLIGAGGAGTRTHGPYDGEDMRDMRWSDPVFVLQPGVHVELNVSRHFVLSAAIEYRYVSGISDPALSTAEFNGVSAQLAFQFGKF